MSQKQLFLDTELLCPNTGHQQPGAQVTSYAIPGGWAVWWRCSSCQHWHMVEKLAPPKKLSPALTRKVSPETVRQQEVKA